MPAQFFTTEFEQPLDLMESCIEKLCVLHLGNSQSHVGGNGEMHDERSIKVWQACRTALQETMHPLDEVLMGSSGRRGLSGEFFEATIKEVVKGAMERCESAGYPELGDRLVLLLNRFEQCVASVEQQRLFLMFLFAMRDSVESDFHHRGTFQSEGTSPVLSFKLFEEIPSPDALISIPKASVEVTPRNDADQADDLLRASRLQQFSALYSGWLTVPNKLQSGRPQQPSHLLRIPLSILAIENSPGSGTSFRPFLSNVRRTARFNDEGLAPELPPREPFEEGWSITEVLVNEQMESLIRDCLYALHGVYSGLLRLRGTLAAGSALLVGPAAVGIITKIQHAAECRFQVEAFVDRYNRPLLASLRGSDPASRFDSSSESTSSDDAVLQAFAAGVDVILKDISYSSTEKLINMKLSTLAQLHLLTNTLQLRLCWLASLCFCKTNEVLRGPALLDYLWEKVQQVPRNHCLSICSLNSSSSSSSSSSWRRETLEFLFRHAATPLTTLLCEWAFTGRFSSMPCNETPLYTVQPDPRLCALSPPLTTSIHKIPACTARCLSSLYEHALSAGIQLRFLASIDTFEVLRFVNELRLIEAERQEEVVGSYWNFGSQMRSQWLPPAQTSLGGPANNKRSGKTAPIEMHRSRQLCLDRLHKSLGIRQTNLSTVFSPDQQDPATPGVGHQIRSNPDNPATWLLDSLQWHVRSQCLVVSQACLSFLLAQPLPQLREHFQILQLLYFQQAGDWADALVDNLYALSELSVDGFAVLEDALRASSLSRLTLPPQSHLDFRVTGDYSPPALVLEALIETNTRNMSLTEALWHHCHHVSASPSTPSSSNFYALDLCQLNYTIPWPYKAVLPDDLMLCLSAVFTVMLKVRYLIRTLSRTRQEWLIRSRHSADKGWVITFLFVSTRFCEAVATFLSLCTNSDALRWDIIEKRYKAGQFKSLDDLVEFNRRAVYKCTIDILTYCGHDSLRQTVETTIDNIMRAVSLCSEGKNTVQPLELESYPELVQALGMTYDSFQSTREEARSVGPTGHVAINFLCDSLSSLVF